MTTQTETKARTFTGQMDRDTFYRWLNPPLPHAERYSRERLLSSYVEVNEEIYWEFLEMLPPMCFTGSQFAICEATTDDVRLGFFKIGERYFAAQVSDADPTRDMTATRGEIFARLDEAPAMSRLYKINHLVDPDAKDVEILAKREREWNERQGPRVGDFVQIGERLGRFSHDWGSTGLQWSECGSFYLGGSWVEFSGGLNPTIPREKLTQTDRTQDGTFWFFHHAQSGAHRGVGCRIPCRVFRAQTSLFTVTTDGTARRIEAVDRSDAWKEGVRLERKALGKHDGWYPASVEVTEAT